MRIGVVADDFTGASDIALTLAEGGMRTAQFIGVPDGPASACVEAGVVALKSRTAPVAEAVTESVAACRWLIAQGAGQVVFKVCSTFDSTDEGNIGPVLDALAAELDEDQVIVCPAFPENGRSVYQGYLFVADRLLNESGMQDHPLTPMKDADLRRVLAPQTVRAVGHVPARTVAQGPLALRAAMPKVQAHVIVDAIHDEDLRVIGAAAQDRKLLCGGSGIAIGLPANFAAKAATPKWQPITGKGVVLSGSCSRATREQVTDYRKTYPSREITAEEAVDGTVDLAALVDWILSQDAPPLVYSSADPEEVRAAQDRFGRAASATAIEGLFSDLAAMLKARGTARIVVAGGETSGAVVKGLAARVLDIGPRIAAGVPMVRTDGMALALKSGNFGGPSFFKEALALMEREV